MNLKKKKTDMMGREEEERDNMKALLDECLTWCIDCTMSPCICVLTKLELRIMQEKVAKMLDNLMKKTGCDTRTPSATTTTTTTSVGNDDEKEEITGKTRGKTSQVELGHTLVPSKSSFQVWLCKCQIISSVEF